jgi:hypothetical protein
LICLAWRIGPRVEELPPRTRPEGHFHDPTVGAEKTRQDRRARVASLRASGAAFRGPILPNVDFLTQARKSNLIDAV